MTRYQLEHIIRAAGDIAGVKEFYILGSQSILGQFPELGEALLGEDRQDRLRLTLPGNLPRDFMRRTMQRSMEADIMVAGDYQKAESIEGAIGELSAFHDTHGYYAQAVDETTCKLPEGWRRRIVRICNANTRYVSGLCLEIHDLLLSKLVARRDKDLEFFNAAVSLGVVRKGSLKKRVNTLPVNQFIKEEIKVLIDRSFHELTEQI